jgi:coenzyme PQQ precursor peptide PqqA
MGPERLGFGPPLERYSALQEDNSVMWIKPSFVELRFGFEVTMYSEYR